MIKEHDDKLFAKRLDDGRVCIYRKNKRFKAYVFENTAIYHAVSAPDFVFALTHDWTFNGIPRDWGSEVILKRLREHDIHSNERLFAQLDAEQEKLAQSRDRKIKNETEAFLADQHSRIKKHWGDVRYANFDMRKDRRAKKNI